MNVTSGSYFGTVTLIGCLNAILKIHTSNEDLMSTTEFSKELEFPSINTNYERESYHQISTHIPTFYLIQEQDALKLLQLLQILGNATNQSFNPRGKFLLISRHFPGELMTYLASLYIVDAIFLNAVTQEISTYFPYVQGSLNSINLTLTSFGKCQDVQKMNLFPPKVPKSWKNTTLSINIRNRDAYAMCGDCAEKGIDIDILNIILDHTHIKGKYYRGQSSLDAEDFRKFNIFVGNYGPKRSDDFFGEFSMSYTDDDVVWLIPAPGQISRWKYFLKIFNVKVWLAYFLTVFSVTITWISVKSFFDNISLDDLLTVPISTYTIFLGQSFDFNTNIISHRILVNLIIFLSIMTNFFFATRLTYLLNGNNMEAKISNLDDVIDNELLIGCTLRLAYSYNNTEKRTEYLKKHHVNCDPSSKCLLRAAKKRDMAVCLTVRRSRFLKDLIDEETGEWRVKVLYPPIFVKQVAVVFQKGFPVFHLFNRHIFNIVESGILNIIMKKYERRTVVDDSLNSVGKLHLDHMVAPLFLWFSGNALALLVFLIERQLKNSNSKQFDELRTC